jgi:hypothetical protein
MKRYVEGENRFQSTLFPESLDDYSHSLGQEATFAPESAGGRLSSAKSRVSAG